MVVGGMRRDVHLKMYSSAKSPSSSAAFDVTVKLVSIPARTFRRPWKTAKRCADVPPITQNCSFLHQSSILTPLHLSSRIPVPKMDIKRRMNHILARLLICTMFIENQRKNQHSASTSTGEIMDLIQAQDILILTFAYLGNDEFIREKTNGRKNTIGQQRDRCYRIDNGVDVCHPLQHHQFSIEAIPYRTMPAQKNFNGSQSPPEHLIQSIRKIDGSRTLECWARRHTIY